MSRFNKLQKASWAIASIACLSAAATTAQASTIAYSAATGATETDTANQGLSAFEFTPTKAISVTALGFTAISINIPGGDAPQVTLWSVNGSLGSLTSLTSVSYTTPELTDSSPTNSTTQAPVSYVSVGPIALSAGQTYLVSAPAYWAPTFSSTNVSVTDASTIGSVSFLSTGPFNNWANSNYTFTSLTTESSTLITTPNFEYTVSAPEPASIGLLAAASLGLLARRRRMV